ncbi:MULTISPECIES: hypothetical protein [unclassified Frigidibacter]|jgi:hypothetical protein|uniref:hypothetical protein n=1 Tax=unclassified Frigidibacter TaxID=2641805 RepID=UPI002271C043|nr:MULTISPECIES: hypothetical protein [unclassified Frigidibacter]MCY1128316.1 hypothetical protein [Frigidibacter sp. RF13]
MICFRLSALLPIACLAALAACSQPRAHANVRLTPDGVKVAPSVRTNLLGVGVTISQ